MRFYLNGIFVGIIIIINNKTCYHEYMFIWREFSS